MRHDNPFGGHAYYLHGNDGRVYYGAHLATFVCGDGAVRIGDTIGTVGNSGNAAGGPTHLHFEVGQNGANKDPYPMSSGVSAYGSGAMSSTEKVRSVM